MSCNACTTRFNFFHKEMGCANCGMSFCSRCLKQKSKIPLRGPGEYSVCKSCFYKLTSGESSSSYPPAAPKAYFKRLENTKIYDRPPAITIYQKNSSSSRPGALSPKDLEIVERLRRLRARDTPIPTEAELRCRLEQLRKQNEYVEEPGSGKEHSESSHDTLLEQFSNQQNIELVHNPQDDIEARLAVLRCQGVRPNENTYISNLHDSGSSEEEEVDHLARKIMDEVAIETRFGDEIMTPTDCQELPWCVLCNADARFRCIDCGGDLYCDECNKEVHRNWGEHDHRVVPYK